jgi:hypothetical protein
VNQKQGVIIFLLLPVLAWTFSLWYQKAQRYKVLEAQRQEMEAAQLKMLQLRQARRGMAVGRPLTRLPVSYQVVGPPPIVGRGQEAILWVSSLSPCCWDTQAWENWRKVLDKYPRMMLITFNPYFSVKDAQDYKSRVNHPRVYFFVTSEKETVPRIGMPGTVYLVDAKGVLRKVIQLQGCAPNDQEVEEMLRLWDEIQKG